MKAGHILVITIDDDGDPSYRIECLRTGWERSCAVWYQHPTGAPCTCECEPCVEGDHGDCESDSVEEVGRKFCECSPADECWYEHALDNVGREMLDFGRDRFTLRVPVDLSGSGFDEPIDVTLALCGYSLAHRNRHQCDCVCVRPAGHDGPHQCSAEAVQP